MSVSVDVSRPGSAAPCPDSHVPSGLGGPFGSEPTHVLLGSVPGLLDSLEGPDPAAMERVARDVHQVTLNATARSLGKAQ